VQIGQNMVHPALKGTTCNLQPKWHLKVFKRGKWNYYWLSLVYREDGQDLIKAFAKVNLAEDAASCHP
jgi:hypothetical protein